MPVMKPVAKVTMKPRTIKKRVRKGMNFSRALFKVHGWFGFAACFMLMVICFSGALAVVSTEIDWLLNPAMRVSPQEKTLPLGEVMDVLHQKHPQYLIESIHMPLGERFAIKMSATDKLGVNRWIYVNPYTAEVQGTASFLTVQRFLRSFHKQLYILPTKFNPNGRMLVCLFAPVLFVLTLTGLYFIRNWSFGALIKKPKSHIRKGVYAYWHKLGGLILVPFLLIIAFTGSWYLVEYLDWVPHGLGERLLSNELEVSDAERASWGAAFEPAKLDQIFQEISREYPGFRPTDVYLPKVANNGGLFLIGGQAHIPLQDDLANVILFNSHSGESVAMHLTSNEGFGGWLMGAINPLHFGSFGGLSVKLLWVVFGLAMCYLIWSGVRLRLLRQKQQRQNRKTRRDLIACAVISIPLLLYGAIASVIGVRQHDYQWRSQSSAWLSDSKGIGPWQVEWVVNEQQPNQETWSPRLIFSSLPQEIPNFKQARVWVGDSAAGYAEAIPLRGFSWMGMRAKLPQAIEDQRLWLGIEDFTGEVFTQSWDLFGWEARNQSIPPIPWQVYGFIAVFLSALCWLLWGWLRLAL